MTRPPRGVNRRSLNRRIWADFSGSGDLTCVWRGRNRTPSNLAAGLSCPTMFMSCCTPMPRSHALWGASNGSPRGKRTACSAGTAHPGANESLHPRPRSCPPRTTLYREHSGKSWFVRESRSVAVFERFRQFVPLKRDADTIRVSEMAGKCRNCVFACGAGATCQCPDRI